MLRRVLFSVCLFLGLASAALAERRVALVLAAEDYTSVRALDNPVNDARAMEAMLEGLGFEVWLETDRDLKRMRRALEDFRQDATGADVALVFFAGHGVALQGVNYLLPTDADPSSSATLAESSLSLEEVQQVLAEVAPMSIMLLDACRDDPFAAGATGSEDGRGAVALAGDAPDAPKPQPGLGRIGRSEGVLFAFSAAPGETAADGDGTNSPFTSALLRHFATKGVELKSALTLVQQDVYDRSRGRQLPYIESGLPQLVFISEQGDLPERDQLLMAMADLTPDLRAEVEEIATTHDMPLAPLYAALISGDLARQSADERHRLLLDAAQSYGQFQAELVKYASDDPRVADLRARAEEQLTLGSFDAARALLTEAAGIDATARAGLKTNFLTRTLSEASTHILNAKAARTDLRYDLAITDLTKAVELYAEIEADLPDRDTRFAYNFALDDLGRMQLVAGNTFGALGAFMTRSEFAEAQLLADPFDFGWGRELVWSLNSVGDVLQQQGYLREAEVAFSRAHDATAKQNDTYPGDPALQRDREVVLNKLGDVRFALNDLAGALSAYQESLGIAQVLLESAPDELLYNQDLSISHERIGDVLVKMGDRAGARDAFDVMLRISQKLVGQYPNDLDIRRSLAIAYERLGNSTRDEGDLDSALAAFIEAMKIYEDLQALDPGNVTRKRDSSVIYVKVAEIYEMMGDVGSALMSHEQARGIRAELVVLDPANVIWAGDLAYSHERVGMIYQQEGEFQGALDAYGACRDMRLAIVAVDPGNLQRQRELGVCLDLVGQALAGLGDTGPALAAQQTALATRRATAAADPTVVQFQLDLTYSLGSIGGLQWQLGNSAAAEAAYAEAVDILQAVVTADPGNLSSQRDIAIFAAEVSNIAVAAGDPARAVPWAELALAKADLVLATNPENPTFVLDQMVAANRLGIARSQTGDHQGAKAAFEVLVSGAYKLSSADPYDKPAAGDYALALYRLGDSKLQLGDTMGARADLEISVAVRQWLVDQDPVSIPAQRDLGFALQKLADTYYIADDRATGLPFEDRALGIMRWIDQQEPGDRLNILDLATALDRTASYYDDPTVYLQESLALLQGLKARGELPEMYESWITNYQSRLGGN